jgi:hypothetical protein
MGNPLTDKQIPFGRGITLGFNGDADFIYDISAKKLTVLNAVIGYSTNTTIRVAVLGGNFTTLSAALDSLKYKFISNDITVTIEIDDGTFSADAMQVLMHRDVQRILIKGKNCYFKSMTSVQSSSGSSGNYSIIINIDSIANITIGNYVIIYNPSGGTNPDRIAGCHVVTDVDVPNTRITITSKNLTGVPTGAVIANVAVIKTILQYASSSGIAIAPNTHLTMQNVVLLGGSSHDGIYGENATSFQLIRVGIVNFYNGINLFYGCNGYFINCGISGNYSTGITLYGNSAIDTGVSSISGNALGIQAWGSSYVAIGGATLSGNTYPTSPAVNTVGNANSYIEQ